MGVGEWREWKECWKGAVEVGYCLYIYTIVIDTSIIYLYTFITYYMYHVSCLVLPQCL